MDQIILSYYKDNAKKLHHMVDRILFRMGFSGTGEEEDFYSLANEVFVEVMQRYDKLQSFDGFLYSCLCNRFKTEMTRRNRQKRYCDRYAVSMDAPVGDGEYTTLGDLLVGDFNIERIVFEDQEEGFSRKMLLYLGRLSELQREVLRLTTADYTPEEIRAELQISRKQYSDCNAAIHSCRNISVLF